MALAAALAGKRVVVVAGAGGVGKTTVSAALSVALARRGERVCVITIDPAKRLADALGVTLGGEPVAVPLDGAAGSLDALMLDVKATFDAVIAEHAPTPEQRDAIYRNRVYRSLSRSIAGAQEYMAMERLHQLSATGRYDRVVLDTPPSRNALDFLDAPGRLLRFIEGRSLRFFLRPSLKAGRFGMRLAGRGASIAFAALERLTGVALLRDLSDFFLAIEGMIDGFHDRAAEVRALLASPDATFVVVTAATAESTAEADFFVRCLRERSLPLGGVVANQVDQSPLVEAGIDGLPPLDELERSAADALVGAGVEPPLAAAAGGALADAERRSRVADAVLDGLVWKTGLEPVAVLPRLEGDIVDVHGLDSLAAPLGLPSG